MAIEHLAVDFLQQGLDSAFADVLVVHSHPLLRAGIAAALAPALLASDAGRDALPPCSGRVRPRVLVGDHHGAVRALAQSSRLGGGDVDTGPRWLVVAHAINARLLRRAIQAGVTGYVHAACDLDVLREAARSVAAGRRYLCKSAAAALAEQWTGDGLTPREVDVLRMLCLGLDNKSIGQRLNVAPGTIKTHVKTLLHKLGVRNRTQAVIEAFKRGLHEDVAPDQEHAHSPLARPSSPSRRAGVFAAFW